MRQTTVLENFVYASSSSVYGNNKTLPFSETQDVANPISLYAATKIANELVAKSYSHLYQIPSTGLRFFTVYGPYGRPDMALFSFTQKILRGEPIPVFNYGKMTRDFTYIDDIVRGIRAALYKAQQGQIYNLACGRQENLMHMVDLLERKLGKTAQRKLMPLQAGDVPVTSADISKAQQDLDYKPGVSIDQGLPQFVEWYLATHS